MYANTWLAIMLVVMTEAELLDTEVRVAPPDSPELFTRGEDVDKGVIDVRVAPPDTFNKLVLTDTYIKIYKYLT